MRISLRSPVRKRIFLSSCCLLGTLYAALSAAYFLAAAYAQKLDLASLQKAIRLDPGNAEYRYELGRYEMLISQEPESAAQSFRAALSLNPHDSRYWLELANAYHVLGATQAQRSALERAIEVDPQTPQTAWQVANFYWARGEDGRFLQKMAVVLQNDPELAPAALERVWRIRPDIDYLLQNVVRDNAAAYSSLLALMVSHQEMNAAAKVWDRLVQLGQPIERRLVFDYVQFLVEHHEARESALAWHQAGVLSGLEPYQPSPRNLIVNGDFGLPILNGGFDWLYEKSPEVSLALDPVEVHLGQQSLSLDFDSHGLDDVGIRQMIPVSPNSTYRFSCYFKTEELRGAGGLDFVLQDRFSGKSYFQSQEMKDAPFWKPLSGDLTTGSDTSLLMLSIRRFPAGGAIRGKLWIDDVSLAPETGEAR
jgi:hypothetical protein